MLPAELDGDRFLGWFTEDGSELTADDVARENLTVTARWESDEEDTGWEDWAIKSELLDMVSDIMGTVKRKDAVSWIIRFATSEIMWRSIPNAECSSFPPTTWRRPIPFWRIEQHEYSDLRQIEVL